MFRIWTETLKVMKLKPQFSLVLTILTILIVSPTQVNANAVSDWNLIAIQRIGAANPAHPPPVVFLDMAIVQAAVYDAVQAIEQNYQPYHVQIPGASGSSAAAAAKAARDVVVNLFPAQTARLSTSHLEALSLVFNLLEPNREVSLTCFEVRNRMLPLNLRIRQSYSAQNSVISQSIFPLVTSNSISPIP
jgi:hypothetical protein